ncbi:MAG TPA: ammonium transporter [Herpetosiphonaceae bacterium]|nr:ammonium transporter [Herpetosiphonaceae bacterium]
MLRRRWILPVAGLAALAIPTGVFAQDTTPVATDTITTQIDIIWLLVASVLVFFMQAGFALVESGFTRSKNAANILMKNLMDFCVGTVLFFAIGYGLMYGTSAAGIVGTDNFFLSAFALAPGSGKSWVGFFFQLVFAATAATIVSGAVAERFKFISYLIYSAVICGVIYPISGHWQWGGGWLFKQGFIDFAGSTLVHSVGGWAALAGTILLGPRLGKFNKDGSSNVIPGHSLTLAVLGVFILWVGWFGFNPGSTLSGMNESMGYIAVTTNMAAAVGAISALILNWFRTGHPDTSMAANGALAGLVAITAGCASVTPMGAFFIGAFSGVVIVYGSLFLENILKLDDPVGAIPVHLFNGVFGTLAVGLFASPAVGALTGMGDAAGLFYGGGFGLLGTQALGVLAVGAWAFISMFLVFFILKKTLGIRVSEREEIEGLDIAEHDTVSYPEFGTPVSGVAGVRAMMPE